MHPPTLTPPSCPRSRAPGPGGRGPQQSRKRRGDGRRRPHRGRAAPHQVLGRAAAGAGAELPRAALHRRQREAAPGRRAEPLPEPGERGRGAPGPPLPSCREGRRVSLSPARLRLGRQPVIIAGTGTAPVRPPVSLIPLAENKLKQAPIPASAGTALLSAALLC